MTFDGSTWTKPSHLPDSEFSSLSCPSSSFCMGVGYQSEVFDGSTWRMVPKPSQLYPAVSCTSSTFCVSAGGDDVESFNGTSWQDAAEIDDDSGGFGNGFTSVSCGSSSFCVAGTEDGKYVTYNGSSWGTLAPTGLYTLHAVSCPSQNFCMAVGSTAQGPSSDEGPGDYEESVTSVDGSSWSKPVVLGTFPGDALSDDAPASVAVSCTSASFCVATGFGTYVFRGVSWTPYIDYSVNSGPAVSCASPLFCMEMTSTGLARRLDSNGRPFAVGGGMDQVSCPTRSFCMAVNQNGGAVTYDGNSWSNRVGVNPGVALNSVSCPSPHFCAAVGGRQAETFNGSSWTAPAEIDPNLPLNDLIGVSCPSASFCMAVDEDGRWVTFTGGSWTKPKQAADSFRSVSCASSTFCAAAGGTCLMIFDGKSWSPQRVCGQYGGLFSVSCPSRSFCAAVGYSGQLTDEALTYNGRSWGSPNSIGPGYDLNFVSCRSRWFCVAVDPQGEFVTFNGFSWSAPAAFDSEPDTGVVRTDPAQASLSCPAASYCMVTDVDGNALTYTAPTITIDPRRPQVAQRSALIGLSCTGGDPGSVCSGALLLQRQLTRRVRRRVHGHLRTVALTETVLLARQDYVLPNGEHSTFALTLSKQARKLLRNSAHHRLWAQLTATLDGGAGQSRTVILSQSAGH